MLIQRVPWKAQPYGAVPSKLLGLTALILPGQSSQDIVSGVELGTVIGTPTRTVNGQGPALQHNANREAIYTSATAAQKSPQGSIVWAGTFTGSPTVAAALGGTTYDHLNNPPYVGIEIKRRVVSANTIAVSYSYGTSAGNVENLQSTGTYTTGDIVAVGVFISGRQHLVVKSASGVDVVSGTRTGTLSYGATARIEVGESLNNRNPAADTALLALSDQAWSLSTAIQVANDVWGQLFQPRSIWVPVSTAGGSVTGTSATTNANDTSTASGTTTVVGTSATTNADDTATASGSVGGAVTGTSATTNADDAGAASGTTTVTGTVAYSNVNDAAAASGWAGAISGTVAVTNADDASSAAGSAGSVQAFSGGWFPPIRRRTKKEIDDERRRLGILPPEVVEEVAAVPVARRRITLQDLIGKKAAAEITNVDLSAAIAASKRRKRQRDDELLMLM